LVQPLPFPKTTLTDHFVFPNGVMVCTIQSAAPSMSRDGSDAECKSIPDYALASASDLE